MAITFVSVTALCLLLKAPFKMYKNHKSLKLQNKHEAINFLSENISI